MTIFQRTKNLSLKYYPRLISATARDRSSPLSRNDQRGRAHLDKSSSDEPLRAPRCNKNLFSLSLSLSRPYNKVVNGGRSLYIRSIDLRARARIDRPSETSERAVLYTLARARAPPDMIMILHSRTRALYIPLARA